MTHAVVYQQQIQVLLYKNVGRTTAGDGVPLSARYQGADRVVDLSPWLSDVSGVRTTKSVRDPAGGFSLTLSDRMHDKDLDSIYGLFEPMDMVEIRMARRGEVRVRNGGKLPIVMRGFVTDVRRAEAISAAGKPQRHVVITGQDYGKLWQILQIFYTKNFPVEATLLTNWKLFTKYGMGFENQSCNDFVRAAIDRILNPFIDRMISMSGGDAPLQRVKIGETGAEPGMVAPTGVNQFQGGTLYSMLHMFSDVGPWNELFLEDREDGVFLVYRHNPFYSAAGGFLPAQFGAPTKEPRRFEIDASDIVSISVSRSDGNVANYYWVDAPRSQMTNGSTAKLMAATGSPDTFFIDYRNSSPDLYGVRKMFEDTNQGDPAEPHHGNGVDEGTHNRQYRLSVKWIDKRRLEIVEQNKDNIVFESGSLRIKGCEDIRAGMYVDVVRGTIKYSFYVVSVDQEFIPFQGFFTTLNVERGTGFIERAQREAGQQSPYLAELATRV